MTDLDTPSKSAQEKPPPDMVRLTVRIDFGDGASTEHSAGFAKTLLDTRSGVFDQAMVIASGHRLVQNVIGRAGCKNAVLPLTA